MNKVQTDNSYFADKVFLRLNNLPEKDIKVLDCYSGTGRIWDEIKKRFENKIDIDSIEIKNYKKKMYMKGDNIKYLMSMDLNQYDVIDLDAYGVPCKQLKIILDKYEKGLIFITFIQSNMGRLPNEMLIKLGYTKKMISKMPILFVRNGIEKFKNYLKLLGINDIIYRGKDNKHYICIVKS